MDFYINSNYVEKTYDSCDEVQMSSLGIPAIRYDDNQYNALHHSIKSLEISSVHLMIQIKYRYNYIHSCFQEIE